ncbi:hypothetical protein OG792_01335 [Micromonospora sp. NBC_01699]|uniref:hypothetical protein n=1 Tax=Micromonospora sp. NBC_01699 TaxID=2975984 RepID=UPI002E2DB843|nr:hypothetical protein [Micromonospora sp. NBC_01699]
MTLKILNTTGCNGGTCPTLYETESGDFLVQGFIVEDSGTMDEIGTVPQGEGVVRVPRELLSSFLGRE